MLSTRAIYFRSSQKIGGIAPAPALRLVVVEPIDVTTLVGAFRQLAHKVGCPGMVDQRPSWTIGHEGCFGPGLAVIPGIGMTGMPDNGSVGAKQAAVGQDC